MPLIRKQSGKYKFSGNSLVYVGPKGRSSPDVHVTLSKERMEMSGRQIPGGFIFRRVHRAKRG